MKTSTTDLLEIESSEEESSLKLKTEKEVIIDFWAPWCGPCKKSAPVFEELSNEMPDVEFVKINIDEDNELATLLGIRSIPSFVYINKSNVSSLAIGYSDKNGLLEFISTSQTRTN